MESLKEKIQNALSEESDGEESAFEEIEEAVNFLLAEKLKSAKEDGLPVTPAMDAECLAYMQELTIDVVRLYCHKYSPMSDFNEDVNEIMPPALCALLNYLQGRPLPSTPFDYDLPFNDPENQKGMIELDNTIKGVIAAAEDVCKIYFFGTDSNSDSTVLH